MINYCMVCDEAIYGDHEDDLIFSMADEANGPYCDLCWMEKQKRGAHIIMDAINKRRNRSDNER